MLLRPFVQIPSIFISFLHPPDRKERRALNILNVSLVSLSSPIRLERSTSHRTRSNRKRDAAFITV